MKRLAVAVVISAISLMLLGAAVAAPPGAVRGSFSKGVLASYDDMSPYISGSDAWCKWSANGVMVHVTIRNRSVERVKVYLKPRYYLRNGGEHGSSFLGAQDFTINARSSRSVLMNAGTPDGVSGRVPIRKCAPMLYLID
jgi:hypothetical protein